MGAAAGPDIVEDGLALYLDAANKRSYPGSEATWADLSKNNHSADVGIYSVNYSSDGYFTLNRSNSERIPIDGYFYDSARISQLTVECFFRPFNINENTILASFDRNEYWRLGWGRDQSDRPKVGMSFSDDTGQIDGFDTNADIIQNQWNHVVFTYNSGIAKLYLGGNFDNQIDTGGSQLGTGGVRYGYIGTGSEAESFDDNNGPGDHFDGDISVFRIYEQELTEAEIRQNFNALRGRYGI